MSVPFIQVENLRFSYLEDDRKKSEESLVLKDISVQIEKGEYVAILGHNGSGKSTFARLLTLILEPTGGKITVDGIEVTDPQLSDEELQKLRHKIGMVFQNPDNQMVTTIVEEDVAFGPENLGLDPAEIRRRVDEALAAVRMEEFSRREASRLSGGQKQRVAIAGVIAMMPECIIFDESTAMLDPQGRKDVLRIMDMLHRERGITILHITHDMNEAARADRILILSDGRIAGDGTPEEIFSRREELNRIGLDVPQCAGLMLELKKRGYPIRGKITTPEDCVDSLKASLYLNGGGTVHG
ncbi:MAG: energy-coupling factor transporter ATPase [Clostridia bacterium]|nr:energy-coupling factor transporter ATPase [Clostridia bacterium]